MASWPGVFHDDAGRIVGFWGLTVTELGPHRLRVGDVELWAWCAWDTLFLPKLLAQPAEVQSRSPTDREPISLHVGPERVERTSASDLLVSIVPARDADDFIRTFCHHIHFFASVGEGERWIAGHEGALLMPVADAFELGRQVNHVRYGGLASGAAL